MSRKKRKHSEICESKDTWQTRPAIYIAIVDLLIQKGIIQEGDRVWEPFWSVDYGQQEWSSEVVLKRLGLDVVCENGRDFHSYDKIPSGVKMTLSNPPYSSQKLGPIIERLFKLNKPFGLVLSHDAICAHLEGNYDDDKYTIINVSKKINCFHMQGVFDKPPQFQPILLLGNIKINNPPNILDFNPLDDVQFGLEVPDSDRYIRIKKKRKKISQKSVTVFLSSSGKQYIPRNTRKRVVNKKQIIKRHLGNQICYYIARKCCKILTLIFVYKFDLIETRF